MTDTIGSRLRAERIKAGLTQVALEKRLNWPTSWVSQIECGHRQPDARTVALLAGALRCKTDKLLPAVRMKS